MDIYTNLLDFINKANQINPSPLEEGFDNLTYNDQGQAFSSGEPVDYTDLALKRATQNQGLVPPLQVQTNRPYMPEFKRQSIQELFRPVMPQKASTNQAIPMVQSGPADIVALIKKYFPKEQWSNAVAIMNQESGGRNIPSQFNKYGTEESYGPFQINLQAHPQMRGKVNIPEENVKYAAQLFAQSQWQPWFNSARKLGLL